MIIKLLIAILSLQCFLTLILAIILLNSPSKRRYISVFKFFLKKQSNKKQKNKYIEELTVILEKMSKYKTGALIVFEKTSDLSEYSKNGISLSAEFSPELIRTVFMKKSPLHDGAMIIKNWVIVSCASFLPTTSSIISKNYGSRHRAAVGITEITDSIALVVSEETGKISIVKKGKIISLPKKKISLILNEELLYA